MGSACSKGNEAVEPENSNKNNNNKNRGLTISTNNNNNTTTTTGSPHPKSTTNPLSSAKAKRQAAVSIVGTEGDDDFDQQDGDQQENARSKKSSFNSHHGGNDDNNSNNNSVATTNILPPTSPGGTTTAAVLSSNSNQHSHASSTNHSRTSSPSAGKKNGRGSASPSSLQHQHSDVLGGSVGEIPASELPPGSVIRRDNSISMPTHNRRRGSSVSLVLTPDQHMKSEARHSPPVPALSCDASDNEDDDNKNEEDDEKKIAQRTMQKLNLDGKDGDPTGIAHAVIESQIHQQRQNAISNNGSFHRSKSGEHQQNQKNQNSATGEEEDDDGQLTVMKSLGDIPLAEGGEMSISVSQPAVGGGTNNNSTSNAASGTGSPQLGAVNARRENSLTLTPAGGNNDENNKAGDEPDAVALGGSSLMLLPTGGGSGVGGGSSNSARRKRGSSVSLVLSPEAHLKSPRCKSPPQGTGFESAASEMAPLELGKRMLEEEMKQEGEETK